jgi:transcriptional regulator with XRE-family HTH domain
MNRLKEIRENRGLSQWELGKITDIYPQKISDFERGRRDLRLNEAKRVADFLGVNLAELVEHRKEVS